MSNINEMQKSFIERAANILKEIEPHRLDLNELWKEARGQGFKPRSLKRAAKLLLSENPAMDAEEARTELQEDLDAIDLVAPEAKSEAA